MSLLDHPRAQELLADADVSADDVRSCQVRLQLFLQRYLPRFYRVEQHALAAVVLQGKLSKLERKTAEPIAYLAGRERKPVQHFVGAGGWDDEAVMAELRGHVAEVLADPEAVLVLDPSSFPKKGTGSCGVARQWCGRLGKVENCQVGVFLAYVTAAGYAPLDRHLYLPKEWAEDEQRRQDGHVPQDIVFQESWRIGLDLIDRSTGNLPFGWVVPARSAPPYGSGNCVTSSTYRATPRCGTWTRPRPRASVGRRGGGSMPGSRPSQRRAGESWCWGREPRDRRWCVPWKRGYRPRTRMAAWGRGNAWSSSAR
jgi:hypothetical protein